MPCIFWLFTSYILQLAWKSSKLTFSVGFLIHFWWEHLKSFHDAAKATHLKDGLFSCKITIPNLRDTSALTNWSDYKFFSMTQKVLEIEVIVHNMTKNPEIYMKIFLVTFLENYYWRNWKSANLENNQCEEAQKYKKIKNN